MDKFNQLFNEKIYNWIVTLAPRLVMALLVVLIGQWLIGILSAWCRSFLSRRKLNDTLRPFLLNLFRFALQLLLLFIIMQLLGIKMTLFAAFVGALGVAAGLALSGTLQNFTSGVLIIMLRPFRVGDFIKAQGEEGRVIAIRLFYTTLVINNNSTLIIPNGKLSNEVIFNLSLNKQRRYDLVLKFKADIDYTDVKKRILDTFESCKQVLKDPAVSVAVKDVQVDAYEVVIYAWVDALNFEESKMILNEILLENVVKVKQPLPAKAQPVEEN